MPDPADELPAGLVAYRRTPLFDQDTMPAGLRHEHRTKPGVWGLIQVVEGRLRYRVLDPAGERMLEPDRPGVVRPDQPHEVEPVGETRFFVEFYRAED